VLQLYVRNEKPAFHKILVNVNSDGKLFNFSRSILNQIMRVLHANVGLRLSRAVHRSKWRVNGLTDNFVESVAFDVAEDSDTNSGANKEGIELLGK
jgi:hypothetical protein